MDDAEKMAMARGARARAFPSLPKHSSGKFSMDNLRCAQGRGECYCPMNEAERKRFQRRVGAGELVKPARGCFADAEWWHSMDASQRHICLARTCARVHPDWVFCGVTAAAIHGFDPPYGRLGKLEVAIAPGTGARNSTVAAFHQMADFDYVLADGLLVTPPARTAIDCMRTLPFDEALAIADAATRVQCWDDSHLFQVLSGWEGARLRGLNRARLVALLVDGRSENGGESIARGNMICMGFMLPDLQVEVRSPVDARRSYRVDYAWPAWEACSYSASEGMLTNPLAENPEPLLAAGPDGDLVASVSVASGSDAGGTLLRSSFTDQPLPIFGELDGRDKYTKESMLQGGTTFDALRRERRREAELTVASRAIVRFSFEEAKNAETLANLLDSYGIPRVHEPLPPRRDAARCFGDVVSYLRSNCDQSQSARRRLEYLERHQS